MPNLERTLTQGCACYPVPNQSSLHSKHGRKGTAQVQRVRVGTQPGGLAQ